MFKSSRLLAKVAVAVLVSANLAAQARERNVILVIGDGMDNQQITIARNYLVGARGHLTPERMTEAALGHLSNKKGFFLMVESASIDK